MKTGWLHPFNIVLVVIASAKKTTEEIEDLRIENGTIKYSFSGKLHIMVKNSGESINILFVQII